VFILAQAAAGLESHYGRTPWAIPGTIQNENYDNGGEGIGYHDSDAANLGGQLTMKDLPYTDLKNWVMIPGTLALTNGQILFQDTNVANQPARFYQLIEH
jgi:hypothetical protein